MEVSNPWDNIEAPKTQGDFSTNRITEKTKHDFWWSKDYRGNPGLAIEFKSAIGLPRSLPTFSSIETTISPDKKFLLLSLLDKDVVKKFRILCHDLINDSQAVETGDGSKLIESLISTLIRWEKLFVVKKIKSPTASQKYGLLGELYCLANFVAKNTDYRRAVDSWQGPKGHEQDFSINGHLIEVKAQLSSSDRIIKISSLEQLDTISGPIWLQHLGLSPATSLEKSVVSINSLIEEILGGLVGDNFGVDLFVSLLELQGFAVENDYGDDIFTIPFLNSYDIRADFPKITRKVVGSYAVTKASYSLNMSDLDVWLINQDTVTAEVFS